MVGLARQVLFLDVPNRRFYILAYSSNSILEFGWNIEMMGDKKYSEPLPLSAFQKETEWEHIKALIKIKTFQQYGNNTFCCVEITLNTIIAGFCWRPPSTLTQLVHE